MTTDSSPTQTRQGGPVSAPMGVSANGASLGAVAARIKRTMGGRVAVATSWTVAVMIVGQIIRLAGNLIMTRILAPEMFGMMSIVLAVQVTLLVLLDIGIRTAVIQSPQGDDEQLLNTAWTFQIIRGVSVWLLIALFAIFLPVATAWGWFAEGSAWASPDLPAALIVASLSMIVASLESTNTITSQRQLKLKRVALLQLAGQVAGFAAMIGLGLLTSSIWALVSSGIVSAAVVTLASHLYLPGIRNRLALEPAACKELSSFAGWILVSSISFVLASNIDRLVFGGVVDARTLGLYSIALNLVLIVETLGSSVLASVVLAALSATVREQPDQLRQKYLRFRFPFDATILCAAGGIFASGPAVIEFLYDDRYRDAGSMLAILSFSLIFFRYNLAGTAYLAAGKPKYLAIFKSLKLISLAVSLPIAYRIWGFDAAIYAVAFHMLAALPVVLWLNGKLGLNSLRAELFAPAAWVTGYLLGLGLTAILSAF
jgi:O-antigen/teichoic acid export membrane protein